MTRTPTNSFRDTHTGTPHQRVVVAMSGGVDSAVAAAMLVDEGHDVVGISLRLAAEPPAGVGRNSKSSSGCCSIDDFRDAAKVADLLGIPHYVLDMREAFQRSVIDPFVGEYLDGRTPSPCILCNREIKFGLLHRRARELGAERVATGHYAIRDGETGRYRLRRAIDAAKDQSYFLFELNQRQLAETLFPIGTLTKDEVRAFARERRLPVSEKPESQEICFVPDGRYADFVARQAQTDIRAGTIHDENGQVIGKHDGVHNFTIGQRRGLGVAASEPLYVSSIDAASATVVAAPRARTLRSGFRADAASWISGRPEPVGSRIDVRIRHRHRPVPGVLAVASGTRLVVEFDAPEPAVTPGQAAVLYRGDEVLGGGWISEALDFDARDTTEAHENRL